MAISLFRALFVDCFLIIELYFFCSSSGCCCGCCCASHKIVSAKNQIVWLLLNAAALHIYFCFMLKFIIAVFDIFLKSIIWTLFCAAALNRWLHHCNSDLGETRLLIVRNSARICNEHILQSGLYYFAISNNTLSPFIYIWSIICIRPFINATKFSISISAIESS